MGPEFWKRECSSLALTALGGFGRRWRPSVMTALIAVAAQACGHANEHVADGSGGSNSAGAGGGATSATGGATSAAGGTTSAGGGATSAAGGASGGKVTIEIGGSPSCKDALFADQVVSRIGEQRVFYSWTTDEQVAELRAGGPLFSRSESPGNGRGLAMNELLELATAGTAPVNALADRLANGVFAKARFAWTNPWATLLGWPGESYGNQLLQIELTPDAWVAYFYQGRLSVLDAKNQPVAIDVALASPERIGALFFQSDADSSARYCGTFSQGSVGFREFVLGNIAMVQRWSLATPEIAQRLSADVARLKQYQEHFSEPAPQMTWSERLKCQWGESYYACSDPLYNYNYSLALPSELYWPSAENLAALIAALEVSMPSGDPLVVTPSG